jgi:hypothetical protein
MKIAIKRLLIKFSLWLQPWSINWAESLALRVRVVQSHLQVDHGFIYFNGEGSAVTICGKGLAIPATSLVQMDNYRWRRTEI